jgi:hypothetical protein
MSMDHAPPNSPLVAIIAKADSKVTAKTKERAMGVCLPVPYLSKGQTPGPGAGGDSPNDWARTYFYAYEKRDVPIPPLRSVEIVTQPKHGKVVYGKNSGGDELLQYIPTGGYLGNDRIEYRVNIAGESVKLVYFVYVTKDNLDNPDPEKVVPCFGHWKISANTNSAFELIVAHHFGIQQSIN